LSSKCININEDIAYKAIINCSNVSDFKKRRKIPVLNLEVNGRIKLVSGRYGMRGVELWLEVLHSSRLTLLETVV
jgi:hypothetical protein